MWPPTRKTDWLCYSIKAIKASWWLNEAYTENLLSANLTWRVIMMKKLFSSSSLTLWQSKLACSTLARASARNTKGGSIHCTVDLLFDWFGISRMSTDNFCFYLQNRLIQTCQTGGQWYSDTSPFSIPWPRPRLIFARKADASMQKKEKVL
jgi:hypothetical protein